jgi:hypothetical protein
MWQRPNMGRKAVTMMMIDAVKTDEQFFKSFCGYFFALLWQISRHWNWLTTQYIPQSLSRMFK